MQARLLVLGKQKMYARQNFIFYATRPADRNDASKELTQEHTLTQVTHLFFIEQNL